MFKPNRWKVAATVIGAASFVLLGASSSYAAPTGTGHHVSKCSNKNAAGIKVGTNNPKFGGYKMTIKKNPGRCWLRAGGVIREIPEGFACTETDIVPIRNVGNHETIEPYDVQGCQWIVTPGSFEWTNWGVWYNNAHGHRVYKSFGHRSFLPPRPHAKRFTCGYLHVCFFQNNDYTGNDTDYTASDVSNNYGTWIFIPQGTRGSVNNNNNLNIQVFSASSQAHQTVFSNTRAVLNGWAGWWCSGPWSVCNQDLPAIRTTVAHVTCSPVRDNNLRLKVQFDAAFNWEHAWLTRNRCGTQMRGYADCRYPGPHGTHEDKYEAGTIVTRVASGKHHLPESINHCRVLNGTQVGTFQRVGYQLNYSGRWHDFWPKF